MSSARSQFLPPWLVAFLACAVAVLGAMGWITYRALTLEVAEAQARAQATRQEAVRLALWRMDSWMTSLIAREAARPYFHYLPFYPADRPYSFFSSDSPLEVLSASDPVSPSPLLTTPPTDVKLYFQIWPDGHLTSPQVPVGGLRGLALLADTSDSTIDAAAKSLTELTQLINSPESRQSLGAMGTALQAAADTSTFRAWVENALTNQTTGLFNRPPPPTASSPVEAQSNSSLENTSQVAAPPPESRANFANQQSEIDPRRMKSANDYEVRQQLADATRNISQNRGATQQYVAPSDASNSKSSEYGTGTAAPTVNNTPVLAEKADTGRSESGKPASGDSAKSERAEAKAAGSEDAHKDKSVTKAGSALQGATAEPNRSDRDVAGSAPRVGTASSEKAPGGLAADSASRKQPTKDERATKEVAAQTATSAPSPPGSSDSETSRFEDKTLSLIKKQGEGNDAKLGAPSTESGASKPPPQLVPGIPGGTQLRSTGSDTFPVVVRSLAVEPTPLVTACVASPLDLKPAPPAPHTAAPFNLFLTRQVPLESGRVVQGMWLDWDMLRSNLLNLSKDLIPGASLELCAPLPPNAAAGDASLMLASIPARLVLPNDAPASISMLSLLTGESWSPTRIAIVGGWLAVLGGIFAIGWVLRQSVQLGERRGRFVSAVTHELRTPLTTFALYSQMLADGMVQDPEAQREYHQTLRKESDRLSRIVESVLDYARLGKHRGETTNQILSEPIRADDLLAALEPHLRSSASVSGLELITELADLKGILLRAERDSIERILVNLVENAGKYAAGHGTDARLHLTARADRRWLTIEIADHGPGIAPGEARRIFAPFERGKAQQDGSKPGLGLGLAFARGLARDLGGDLTLLPPRTGFGAIFALRLPAEQEPANCQTAPKITTDQESTDSPPSPPPD